MPGLVPGIHAAATERDDMDGWDKKVRP